MKTANYQIVLQKNDSKQTYVFRWKRGTESKLLSAIHDVAADRENDFTFNDALMATQSVYAVIKMSRKKRKKKPL